MKKISALGKKVKVHIPSTNPKAFEKQEADEEAEKNKNQNQNNKIHPTKFTELKKKEKNRKNLIKKAALFSSSSAKAEKSEASEAKDKNGINFNVKIGIVNKNGGAACNGKSETYTSFEKNGEELSDFEEEKSSKKTEVPKAQPAKELKEPSKADKSDRENLGFKPEPQKEFLKETAGASKRESDANFTEADYNAKINERSESANNNIINKNLKGSSSAEIPATPSLLNPISKSEIVAPAVASQVLPKQPPAASVSQSTSSAASLIPAAPALSPETNKALIKPASAPTPAPITPAAASSLVPAANQVSIINKNNNIQAPLSSPINADNNNNSLLKTTTPPTPAVINNNPSISSIPPAIKPSAPSAAVTPAVTEPSKTQAAAVVSPLSSTILNTNTNTNLTNTAVPAVIPVQAKPVVLPPTNANNNVPVDPRNAKYLFGLGDPFASVNLDSSVTKDVVVLDNKVENNILGNTLVTSV